MIKKERERQCLLFSQSTCLVWKSPFVDIEPLYICKFSLWKHIKRFKFVSYSVCVCVCVCVCVWPQSHYVICYIAILVKIRICSYLCKLQSRRASASLSSLTDFQDDYSSTPWRQTGPESWEVSRGCYQPKGGQKQLSQLAIQGKFLETQLLGSKSVITHRVPWGTQPVMSSDSGAGLSGCLSQPAPGLDYIVSG